MIGDADDKRFSHEFIVTVSKTFFEKVQENAFFCFTCQTNMGSSRVVALVAQLVEHLICNQGVAGSNPAGGTSNILKIGLFCGSRDWPAFKDYV